MSEEGRSTIHLEQQEDFCIVSASIREGILISVSVQDQNGQLLHSSD